MRMLNYSILGITMMVVSAAFGQSKTLSTAEVVTLKEKVAANTQTLQSLVSDFTQTKHLDYMEHDIKSTGKLYFRSPSKIRWEYTDPTTYVVVFDKQKMHLYDGNAKKDIDLTTNRRLKGLNDILIGTVQGGNIFDESRFNISYHRDGTGYSAILIPKDKAIAKYIKQVELAFDTSTYLVKRVKITDPTLDYTLIKFENQRRNTAVSDDKFVIK
ncbi:LolA family protein [Parapedobacter tibetensis]|uniref:LolA family protein n=1 Tax=Parapedobacter tibetensis TaxID=2972951 RepID=UPI00214DA5AE|nr:outer membrane lipoprotein carrier protein LolA [Parapedobacter tibetensis]